MVCWWWSCEADWLRSGTRNNNSSRHGRTQPQMYQHRSNHRTQRSAKQHRDDDDEESESYVHPLLQLETVMSVLVICSDKQFSFRSRRNKYIRWQLRSGTGREIQVDGPAMAKLWGPHRSVLVAGTARSPCAAERRWRRPALSATGWHMVEASSSRHYHTNSAICEDHRFTGSQWSVWRIGVNVVMMMSPGDQTSGGAEFCTDWRRFWWKAVMWAGRSLQESCSSPVDYSLLCIWLFSHEHLSPWYAVVTHFQFVIKT